MCAAQFSFTLSVHVSLEPSAHVPSDTTVSLFESTSPTCVDTALQHVEDASLKSSSWVHSPSPLQIFPSCFSSYTEPLPHDFPCTWPFLHVTVVRRSGRCWGHTCHITQDKTHARLPNSVFSDWYSLGRSTVRRRIRASSLPSQLPPPWPMPCSRSQMGPFPNCILFYYSSMFNARHNTYAVDTDIENTRPNFAHSVKLAGFPSQIPVPRAFVE